MSYISIDEVQNIDSFEKAINSIHLKDHCDIFITGSNACILSSEWATLLTGRYVKIEMLPLSFKEYASVNDRKQIKEEVFNNYLEFGSFPYVSALEPDKELIQHDHEGLYSTLFIKDNIQKNGIDNVTLLERLTKFLMQNIGCKTSSKKISDSLKVGGLSGN